MEKRRTKPGTAEDVAKLAKVSIYTVSRVFSGSQRVAEGTRKRVLAIAEELGYQPNPVSRALRSGRMNSVAFVLAGHELVIGEFYATMLGGLYRAVARNGMDVLISVVPKNMAVDLWVHRLADTGACSAMAVVVEDVGVDALRAMESVALPLILLNYIQPPGKRELQIPCVGYDNFGGAQQAVRHLVSLGHRQIAFFGGPEGWQDSERREEGFRSAMAEAGLAIEPRWTPRCSFEQGFHSGRFCMDAIFGMSLCKPTAVLCATDDIAAGVVQSARAWGSNVPKDLSVIGFNNQAWTEFYTPPLTTIEHQGWTAGLKAGEVLMSLCADAKAKLSSVVLPTHLVVRQSTAPPADS